MNVRALRRYKVRPIATLDSGTYYIVGGPNVARSGLVVWELEQAFEAVGRAEAHRLAGHSWKCREVDPSTILLYRMHAGVRSDRPAVFRSWQQAARFLFAWRFAGRDERRVLASATVSA